jgi:hypothetical protein
VNLGELKAAVSDELVVPDIDSLTLTRHINLAIRRIERNHDYTAMENLTTFTPTVDEAKYSIPTVAPRYKDMRKVWIEYGTTTPKSRWFVERTSSRESLVEYPITSKTSDTNTQNFPSVFFVDSQYLEFYPAPKAVDVVSVLYYRFLPDLAVDTDENFFTRDLFDAVIYGAAMETARMLEHHDKMAIFNTAFKEAMDEGVTVDERERVSGNQLVPARLPSLGFSLTRY